MDKDSIDYHEIKGEGETNVTKKQFGRDNFAKIQNGRLKLKRDDKATIPDSVTKLQKVIDTSMPSIRIEQLLMAVDELTHFSRHFIPIQGHRSRPNHALEEEE
jgi:hypothetical protein